MIHARIPHQARQEPTCYCGKPYPCQTQTMRASDGMRYYKLANVTGFSTYIRYGRRLIQAGSGRSPDDPLTILVGKDYK